MRPFGPEAMVFLLSQLELVIQTRPDSDSGPSYMNSDLNFGVQYVVDRTRIHIITRDVNCIVLTIWITGL